MSAGKKTSQLIDILIRLCCVEPSKDGIRSSLTLPGFEESEQKRLNYLHRCQNCQQGPVRGFKVCSLACTRLIFP